MQVPGVPAEEVAQRDLPGQAFELALRGGSKADADVAALVASLRESGVRLDHTAIR
jgi:hypothetical protein